MKLTPATLPIVCAAILEMGAKDQRMICKALNAALDDLASQDAFGTEEQNDPAEIREGN